MDELDKQIAKDRHAQRMERRGSEEGQRDLAELRQDRERLQELREAFNKRPTIENEIAVLAWEIELRKKANFRKGRHNHASRLPSARKAESQVSDANGWTAAARRRARRTEQRKEVLMSIKFHCHGCDKTILESSKWVVKSQAAVCRLCFSKGVQP